MSAFQDTGATWTKKAKSSPTNPTIHSVLMARRRSIDLRELFRGGGGRTGISGFGRASNTMTGLRETGRAARMSNGGALR